MKHSHLFAVAVLSLVGICASAQQTNKWGTVEATYTVGSSKLVPKDQGSLEVVLNLNCVEKASDISSGISDLVSRLDQVVKQESGYSFNTLTPEINTSSQAEYNIQYDSNDVRQLNPHYVDVCKNNAKVAVGAGAIDLTKKFFSANATLKIETKGSLSGLTILRQKLQQFAETLNKQDATKQITVEKEVLGVSADKTKEVTTTLSDQNRLTGTSKQSRIALDQALAGGFSELFITSVETNVNQYPEYARYRPVLTENGKSKVTVPYVFSIQYNPKNVANSQNVPWTGADHGTLSQEVDGVVEVDTDYYVAQLNLRTMCQLTKTAASEKLILAFNHFKKLAQTVVTQTKGSSDPYERLEETVGVPSQDGQWEAWERVSTQTPRGEDVAVKSYISLCNGYVASEVKEANWTYAVSHSMTLITKNFAALKQLAEAANDYTEKQRAAAGSQRVEVELSPIIPHLKDAKQFEVVDVLAYRSALNQLIDPQGEVAKKLLDEIQAGEAYYTATRGYGPRTERAMAAAAPAPGGRMKAASNSSYDVVVTNDGNIPLTEVRLSHTYKVVYRPNKDLVSILKEARGVQAPAASHP